MIDGIASSRHSTEQNQPTQDAPLPFQTCRSNHPCGPGAPASRRPVLSDVAQVAIDAELKSPPGMKSLTQNLQIFTTHSS
ncbi:MAG: hypothetical protein QOH16_674 [Gaiellaceae bacterium]|nr:hypothetical protein [Gaiellaceae bacterium]